MRFKEFNSLINPTEQPIYVPMWNGSPEGRIAGVTFNHMAMLMSTDARVEAGLLLPQDMVVIEITSSVDARYVEQIIQARNETVFAVKNHAKLQVYALASGIKNATNAVIALGAKAKVLTAQKRNQLVILPFKHPTLNTSAILQRMRIVHSNGIGPLPVWLTPLPQAKRNSIRFPLQNEHIIHAVLPHMDHLRRHRFSELELILNILSEHVCESPLGAGVISQLLSSTSQEINEEDFFDGGYFLHNKMADYILEKCYVKKAERGTLYHYNEQRGIYEENEEYLKSIITRTVPVLKDTQKNEVLKYLASYLELEKAQFDSDEYKVSFRNCRIDILNDMTTEPLSPETLDTIQLAVEFNPDAHHPVVDEFFQTASCNNPEVEQLLYESIGYTFLKTVHLSKSFILVGEGRNGKSTFLDLINALVGDENSTAIDLKSMGSSFRVSNLQGKLVSLAGDISSTPMSDSDLFKSLSSGDKILVEKKYQQAVEERLFATLFFSANKLPRTPDTTYGFYRRFCIIPFDAELTSVSKVEGERFKRALLSQEALEYVAYKAILAIHKVLTETNDFIEPQVCKDMLNQYRIENSSPLQWAYEYIQQRGDITNKDLHMVYAEYKIWCEVNGFRAYGFNRFIDEITVEFGYATGVNEQNKNVLKRTTRSE